MRASSSWIKLQFVVRKHVMNTYQMHTLSLFLFYHIFLFFCLFDSHPHLSWLISSLLFWWSVILMWHIQLRCIIHPFKCTCVCICVHIVIAHVAYICQVLMSSLCQIACTRGQLCANLSTIVCDVVVHCDLCPTLSRASVGMPSSGGCKGGGLVHWSGQGHPRTHSNSC